MDVQGIHDQFWAGRSVEIVRRGSHPGSVDHPGPAFYLLTDKHALLLFDVGPLVDQFNWLKPRVMRLRIIDTREDPYAEVVRTAPDGRLLGIQRRYRAGKNRVARAFLTPDVEIARLWAGAADRRTAIEAVKHRCATHRFVSNVRKGSIFDSGKADEVDRCLQVIQQTWKTPNATIDGIYQFSPGVWVHESVLIHHDARLVPPLWLGAGQRVNQTDAVIGPGGLIDHLNGSTLHAATAVSWNDINSARFPWTYGRGLGRRSRFSRKTKRLFDILFSSAVLAVTLPLYPFIMLAIYWEDGLPLFFRHRRQCFGGREFDCIKFRTMQRSAEGVKDDLRGRNEVDGPQFYIQNDPRRLHVGRFLRDHQLDELPQFWNVLVGDMSVVGPRPSPDNENQFCPAWREARLSVRPGVTGLWQVNRTRKPQTDFQEWIRYDLEYVQHQSWRLDFWIIAQTIRKLLTMPRP